MKYHFDTFILNTDLRELSNNGEPVKIEPKVFELLLHLVENHDRVVSRDELNASVWDGRFISEAAMSSGIHAVRTALGDDGKTQRHIKTLHGHGFRLGLIRLTSQKLL